MPRIPVILFVAALLGGCAGSQSERLAASTTVNAAKSDDELGLLRRKQVEDQKQIAELAARVSLLEAEARKHRDALAPRVAPAQPVHIGAAARRPLPMLVDSSVQPDDEGGARDEDTSAVVSSPRGKHERVPTLRLYGHGPESRESDDSLPQTSETLPVAPLPQERGKSLSANAETDAGGEAGMTEYREALRLLRERRYDEALAIFDQLATQHPELRAIDKVMYWRGEAHYAKRDYQLAKQEFETLLGRFPQSEKLPDTLLKLGLCLRRLGDEARAQAYFRRVQKEYPSSEAAVIATREGST